jgi:hypothetical protein
MVTEAWNLSASVLGFWISVKIGQREREEEEITYIWLDWVGVTKGEGPSPGYSTALPRISGSSPSRLRVDLSTLTMFFDVGPLGIQLLIRFGGSGAGVLDLGGIDVV